MKTLLHEISTDFKYLYPCIASAEAISENEILVETETKVRKLYQLKMSVDGMDSLEEDFWGRFTFKNEQNQYFCELDGLLYYKGNSFDGEPHYPVNKKINMIYPDIDENLSNFQDCIQKIHKYIDLKPNLELISLKFSIIKKDDNQYNDIILCTTILKIK